jgi:nitroimidazol reductase NimA-like FMN-containing flavoprotein (pyridoxamine 5'-phosphate oxidase superfamily)
LRRKEKEITSIEELEDIIKNCSICRLSFCDGNIPYIVPVNFGYKDGGLYFHSAPEGRKIEIITRNNNVCIEFDTDVELIPDEEACKYNVKYRSVIAFGKAYIIDDFESKIEGYNILMEHYSQGPFDFQKKKIDKSIIVKIEIESMTGKKSGI